MDPANLNTGGQQAPAEYRSAGPTTVRTRPTTKSERRARSVPQATDADARFVSVKTLAKQWDCSRTTVCRILQQAGVPAYFLGKGRNGTKRYRRQDVDAFVQSIEHC